MLLAPLLLGLTAHSPTTTEQPLPPALWEVTPQEEAAEEEKLPKWSGSLTLGASKVTGNTKNQSAAATFDAEYKRERDRTILLANWNYNEDDGDVTLRRLSGKADYNYFETEKLYYLGQTTGQADTPSGLQLRFTAGAGAGYQFRDDEVWAYSGELGLSWLAEDYEQSPKDDYWALRAAAKGRWTPNEQWDLTGQATIFPSIEDSEDVYSNLIASAKYQLSARLFAQFQWIWDWNNTPPSGVERSDNIFNLTIGWTF